MSQNVLVGTLGQTLGGLYGGASPITYEEGGTNGFGVRMTSVRMYYRDFTSPFSSGGADEVFFKSGHSLVVSTSNMPVNIAGYTHKKCVNGTYDTDITNMFTRMYGMPFDSAVAGGSTYGGLTQPYIYYIYTHEVDHGPKLYSTDTAADFIAAWRHVWAISRTVATGLGVPASRVRFCWNVTGWNIPSCDQFYPGDAYVDVIGVDPYANDSATATFAGLNSKIWPWIRGHNKPMCYPETNDVRANISDSARVQSYWIDVAAQINALDIPVEFLNIFLYPDSTVGYQINKIAGASASGKSYPLIHSGIASMISALGNNAIRTGVGQAKPVAPTGLSVTSAVNGQTAAVTWSANPGGDNVTSYDIFTAPGFVTTGGVKVASVNAPTTSYTLSTTPGNPYTVWVRAVNSAGAGPVSVTPFQFTASVPGPTNHSPNITSANAAVDGTNAQVVHFTAVASDPDSNPITYTWVVKNGVGTTVDTFTGATVDRTYQTSGGYTWVLTVADNGTPPLSVQASGSFPVVLNPNVTTYNQWDLTNFLPGVFVELLGKGLLPIFQDLDTKLGGLLNSHGEVGELLGSCGQTFDPGLAGSGSCNAASGVAIWAKLKCRSSTISSINTITTQAQIGTGSLVAVADAGGNLLTFDGDVGAGFALYSGTNVDAWLTHAAGDTTYVLDTPIVGITPGSDITIIVFTPATTVTTYPHFVASAAPTNAAVANGNTAAPLFGSASGQTTITNPAPFASYAAIARPYFAINP